MMKSIFTLLFVLGLVSTCWATQPVAVTPNSDFIVRRKIVEFSPLKQEVIGVPASNLGLPYYYNVRALSDDELADRIAAKVVQKLLEAQGIPNPVPTDSNPDGNTGESPKPIKPTQFSGIQKIFQNKCANCHGETPRNNQLTLINNDGSIADVDAKVAWHVFDRTAWISDLPESERMPLNGPQLDENELQEIMKWARSK